MDRARRLPWMIAAPFVLGISGFAACSGDRSGGDDSLRRSFPQHADEALHARRAFVADARGGFAAQPSHGMHVTLPARGDGAIVFSTARGNVIRVREDHASGSPTAVESALRYARAGGASYWSVRDRGVEEWLDIDAGSVVANQPVATWSVEGGRFAELDGVVAVVDADRRAMLRVEAPKAYGVDGREIDVDLYVVGDRLALRVDADHERVLIDPLWSDANDMVEGRSSHVSTLLADGRVLVAGGFTVGDAALSSVEVYDPTTNLWSTRAPMPAPRGDAAIAHLPGDDLLVLGGWNGDPFSSTFHYDVAGNSWSSLTSMGQSRSNHTATELEDGSILVFGGSFVTDGERFDPGTSSWTTTGAGSSSRGKHTATRLLDGRVLLAGGGDFEATSSADIYDPSDDSMTPTGSLNQARLQAAAALLPDGRVLVSGGDGGSLQTAEIYDPIQGIWFPVADMNTGRARHTLTALRDGTVVAIGGTGDLSGISALADVEVYDPMTNTWTGDNAMVDSRVSATATLLDDGNVLLAGGFASSGSIRRTSAERYLSLNPLLDLGASCLQPAECQSGFCTDDYCCERACDGECEQCGGGVCAAVENFMPCTGGTCQAGVCMLDLLPLGESCFDGGECDSGFCADGVCCNDACDFNECFACSVLAGGPVDGACLPAPGNSCFDGTSCTTGDTCDGEGQCVGDPIDCTSECREGNSCGKGACIGDFPDGTDCSGGGQCLGGVCIPDELLADGSICQGGAQCLSDNCVDGVCCNTACFDFCLACSVQAGAAQDGTCGPADEGDPCGKGGTCDGGTCAPPPLPDGAPCVNGAECDSDRCVDDVCCESACTGACMACSEDAGGSVNGACTVVDDGTACAGGACEEGVCVPGALLGLGEPCDTAAACDSDRCVDEVCCSSACTGECSACSEAEGGSEDGTCTPVDNGTACEGGTCDDGLCVIGALLELGDPCEDAAECDSAFCAEGVCCDTACDGACDACTTDQGADQDGTCAGATGRACDDGNLCTQTDACDAGSCEGTEPIACTPGACQVTSACSEETGGCVAVSKPDGAPCEGGICVAGSCTVDPDVGTLGGSGTGNPGATSGNASGPSGSGSGANGAAGTGSGRGSGDDVDGAESDGGCNVGGSPRGAVDLAWLAIAAAIGARWRGKRRRTTREAGHASP